MKGCRIVDVLFSFKVVMSFSTVSWDIFYSMVGDDMVNSETNLASIVIRAHERVDGDA